MASRCNPRVLIVTLLALLLPAASAQAGWRDVLSPSKNWQRVKNVTSRAADGCTGYCRKKVDHARANQQKNWGLKLPADFDPGRPLVVLIHGMNSDHGIWHSMGTMLQAQKIQFAFFNYPSDGPIPPAAESLADHLNALRQSHPNLRLHLVAHSMGAIVARAYLEGPRYAPGTIDRFIAIAPPNHGAALARYSGAMELHHHYWLWRTHDDYSMLWMFTDGHGEGAQQILPNSAYLREINARPRREGVRYTIIAGNQHLCWRKTANAIALAEDCLSDKVWGLRQTHGKLADLQGALRERSSSGDGAVSVESARLEGVIDTVILPADHTALVMHIGPTPPAAWPVIRERLQQ